MYHIEDHTVLESGERRLVPESDTESAYDPLPFSVEGIVFQYPPSSLREQIKMDGWHDLLEAKAGQADEIVGTVYVCGPFYHTVGLLHFEDSAREVAMVADKDVLRQITSNMLQYDDWRVSTTHIDLDEYLHNAVNEFFEETA